MYTIETLLSKVNQMVLKPRHSDCSFEKHVKDLLKEYYLMVDRLSMRDETVLREVESVNNTIGSVLKDYSKANIASAISELERYIKNSKYLLTYSLSPSNNDADKFWYRMRIQEKHKKFYQAREMFHIPFELRGKVNTQRFSIPGYPCLYISRSIWATWEEMHEPKLDEFCVSCLKPIINETETVKLLDLRMIDETKPCSYDIRKILVTLPFAIACSIKVQNPDDNFKPEYIMPQLVMLALVHDTERIGCIYTSTQRNSRFNWDIRKLDNIALPVKSVKVAGYCSKLSSMFDITDSTSYELDNSNNRIGVEYETSIFGKLEEKLKTMDFKSLCGMNS